MVTLPSIFDIHANARMGQITDTRGQTHLHDIMKRICDSLGIVDFSNSQKNWKNF